MVVLKRDENACHITCLVVNILFFLWGQPSFFRGLSVCSIHFHKLLCVRYGLFLRLPAQALVSYCVYHTLLGNFSEYLLSGLIITVPDTLVIQMCGSLICMNIRCDSCV